MHFMQVVMAMMLGLKTLLSMLAILLLMEKVDMLIVIRQQHDVYICNFVATLLYCQRQLITFYLNFDNAFKRDKFHYTDNEN